MFKVASAGIVPVGFSLAVPMLTTDKAAGGAMIAALSVGSALVVVGFGCLWKATKEADKEREQDKQDAALKESERIKQLGDTFGEKFQKVVDDSETKRISREHEAFLDAHVDCSGGCGCKVPRRELWRLSDRDVLSGHEVCDKCFFRQTQRWPSDANDKRAF
jgi:hypothetical protein